MPITTATLRNYLNRDVFERLYNTPTTASRMQRVDGIRPAGWDDEDYCHQHILFGSPHKLEEVRPTKIPAPKKYLTKRYVAVSPNVATPPAAATSTPPRKAVYTSMHHSELMEQRVATASTTPKKTSPTKRSPTGVMEPFPNGTPSPSPTNSAGVVKKKNTKIPSASSNSPPRWKLLNTSRNHDTTVETSNSLRWEPKPSATTPTSTASSSVVYHPAQPKVRPPTPTRTTLIKKQPPVRQTQNGSSAATKATTIPRSKQKTANRGTLSTAGKEQQQQPPPPPKRRSLQRQRSSSLQASEFPSLKEAVCIFRSLCSHAGGGADTTSSVLSLQQVSAGIDQVYPSLVRHKALALAAYRSLAMATGASSGDGGINATEFRFLIYYLYYFNTLWDEFVFFDDDEDLQIIKGEFILVAAGLDLFDNAETTYAELDPTGVGSVLFEELCAICAKRKMELLDQEQQAAAAAAAAASHANKNDKTKLPQAMKEDDDDDDDDGEEKKNSIETRTSTTTSELPPLAELLDLSEPPSQEKCRTLFQRLDRKGQGALLLEDADRSLAQLYPELGGGKQLPAMRSYQNLTSHRKNGVVLDIDEFCYYLLFLVYFNTLWEEFVFFDEDDDLRISRGEFIPVANKLGFFDDAQATFDGMDPHQEGFIRFEEFCALCATLKLESALDSSGTAADETKLVELEDQRDTGTPKTTTTPLLIPSVEKELPSETYLLSVFDSIGTKKSNKLSLVDVERYLVEHRPEYYSGRTLAITQAFQAADQDQDGFIRRTEFPFFSYFLMYYDQCWDKVPMGGGGGEKEDSRLSKAEFALLVDQLVDVAIDADQSFAAIDVGGTGFIRFGDLCALYATTKLNSTHGTRGGEHSALEVPGHNVSPDGKLAIMPLQEVKDPGDPLSPIAVPQESSTIDLVSKDENMLADASPPMTDDPNQEPGRRPSSASQTTDGSDERIRRSSSISYSAINRIPIIVPGAKDENEPLTAPTKTTSDKNGSSGVSKKKSSKKNAVPVTPKALIFGDSGAASEQQQSSRPQRDENALSNDDLLDLFDEIDTDGRRMLTHAELTNFILDKRPEWNVKSAITRAYRAADKDRDGFVRRAEFPFFYRLIASYTKFWDPNRRISKKEFEGVAWKLGVKNVNAAFSELDKNEHGFILMKEFVSYKERIKREKEGKSSTRASLNTSLQSVDSNDTMDSGATLFPMELHEAELEDAIRDALDVLKTDDNDMIPIVEFERYMGSRRPKWNHKAAIVHAYTAVETPNDDLLHKKDIPFILYFIVFYQFFWRKYTTLDGNGERRITKRQLSRAARHLRIYNVDETFDQLDTQRLGHILFDTLCAYCAKQKLEESDGSFLPPSQAHV